MKAKKRFVTILEMLIAFFLMSLLLSALLGYWAFVAKLRQKIAQQEEKSFKELAAGTRLASLFTALVQPKEEKDFFFFTEDKNGKTSLVFTFDNGTGQGPLFSNQAIGRLLVDSSSRLILLTWPAPSITSSPPIPCRKELLLEKVSLMRFKFLYPDESDWTETTLEDTKKLPLIIKLEIVREGDVPPLHYQFFVSNSQAIITYP